jgi:hypothetical protein
MDAMIASTFPDRPQLTRAGRDATDAQVPVAPTFAEEFAIQFAATDDDGKPVETGGGHNATPPAELPPDTDSTEIIDPALDGTDVVAPLLEQNRDSAETESVLPEEPDSHPETTDQSASSLPPQPVAPDKAVASPHDPDAPVGQDDRNFDTPGNPQMASVSGDAAAPQTEPDAPRKGRTEAPRISDDQTAIGSDGIALSKGETQLQPTQGFETPARSRKDAASRHGVQTTTIAPSITETPVLDHRADGPATAESDGGNAVTRTDGETSRIPKPPAEYPSPEVGPRRAPSQGNSVPQQAEHLTGIEAAPNPEREMESAMAALSHRNPTALGSSVETITPAGRAPSWNLPAVVRQVADMIVIRKDDLIEVRLTPEELGQVRIVVTQRENSQHVSFWIDRPDVLDQLRRNSDLMMRQLSDAGLGNSSLEFRQGTDGDPNQSRYHHLQQESSLAGMDAGGARSVDDAPVPQHGPATYRLDLRM